MSIRAGRKLKNMFLPEVKSKIGEDISILIKLDNHPQNYLCDCGDASELTIKDCQQIAVIFISHTHIDHFINFDTILRHQLGSGKNIIICGPEGITQQVQAKINGYNWNLIGADSISYEIREIIDESTIKSAILKPPNWSLEVLPSVMDKPLYSNEKFEVSFTILDHKTPSIAYSFKEKDTVKINLTKADFKGGSWVRVLKAAYEEKAPNQRVIINDQTYLAKDLFHLLAIKKGDTLGIIMDHAANEANHQKIEQHFKKFNKVFIESFHLTEDIAQATLNYHSYATASGKIMQRCQVKEAIPIHFSRRYDVDAIDILIAEFNRAYRGEEKI